MFNLMPQKNVIAIDMGSYSLKVVEGQFINDKLKINNFFEIILDDDIYNNGLIINEDALIKCVEEAFKKNKLRAKKAIITLESSEILKREIVIPKVDESDMAGLISFEVSQYLPIKIDDYVMQYKVLSYETIEDLEKCHVVIAAMPKEMAKAHYDFLFKVGLEPLSMNLNGSCMQKVITNTLNNNTNATNTCAYIDFGHSKIEINIVKHNVNKLNRILRLGMDDVDAIISKNKKISKKEALENRISFSDYSMIALREAYNALNRKDDETYHEAGTDVRLNFNEFNQSSNENDNTKITVIQSVFDYVYICMEEIEKVFKYYMSRDLGNSIDIIYIYGGPSVYKNLDKFIEEKLNIKTEILNASKFDFILSKQQDDYPPIYYNAIGALMQ